MPIKLNGSSSGYTQIEAAATAGDNTLTLPTASGTLMTTGGTNTFTANQVIEVTDDTNAALRITQLGTGNALLVEDSTNPDSTPFVVGASGKVGIGTASPSFALDVSSNTNYMTRFGGTLNNYLGIQIANASNGSSACSYLQFGNDALGYASYIGHNSSTSTQPGGTNALTLYQTLNAPMVFFTNSAERMRIDSSGNVGIGTNSPSYALDVVSADTSTGYAQRLRSNGTATKARLQFTNNTASQQNGYIEAADAQYLAFATATTERMRIQSDGAILIGTTDGGGTTGPGLKILQTGITYTVTAASTAGTNFHHVYSTGAAAYRFYVGAEGKVYCTSTTISAISDARLKENVRDLDVGLGAINQLRPRLFDWKPGKGQDSKNVRGFIAQEIEEVFPDLIDEWLDPAPEGEEPYKSVRQDLIPVLVKAVQELSAKIDALEARLAALENA